MTYVLRIWGCHFFLFNYEKNVLTVMVINSTNINETNNHHSTELTEHKHTTTYGVGNPGPVIPIFITGFATAIHILVNDEKHAHIRFHS